MAYTTMREVSRYRAVMPREAWWRHQEPRERPRRNQAVTDLIAGLAHYFEFQVRTLTFAQQQEWVMFAAKLVQKGWGMAPDGSRWEIVRRIDYR